MTDPEIIEECRKGNMNSFRTLIEDTSPYVYRVALRMVGQRDLAKDIVQECMVTVWQNLAKIKSVQAYKKWVYRITLNKCYDELRKKQKNPEKTADERTWEILAGKTADENVTSLDSEESIKVIDMLTSRLSPRQKAVFILCEIDGMSHEEICEVTGMTKTTIKSNLYYARKNITGLLEKYL